PSPGTTVNIGCTFPTGVAAPILLETSTRSPGKVHPFPGRSTGFKHCSTDEGNADSTLRKIPEDQ
ncbi:MAG TPA: hypothetical protein VLW50_30300, partial [Streptosporangiaceae bacterium]|nr:hypothetical protein [Streptosporangiaceae bacterium]